MLDNWSGYHVFTVVVIACGSIPKGYDEGGFSSAVGLASFKTDFGLLPALWADDPQGLVRSRADILSFGVLGAAFGSLICLLLTDRIGRLRSWQLAMVVYMTGNLMQTWSCGITTLMLFARLWGGLGAGGLTVVSPLYLSEVAPARSRGMVVGMYMVMLLSFLTVGFFVSYGASKWLAPSSDQYRLVMGIVLVPAGLALVASFFLSDTPRWLASHDRGHEAIAVLARLRSSDKDSDAIEDEYEELQRQIREGQQMLSGASFCTIVKGIATIRTYRTRLLLGLTMQTVAQWSGGNGITYYIPQIFTYAGVAGENGSLISSGAYGLVKLLFTMAFTWGLVDVFGRRGSFLVGLSLQCVSHVYMSVYTSLHSPASNRAASNTAIAAVFVYTVGWSIGLCTVQYLYGTEMYPTRIRSVCYASNMALHWFFQFAVVKCTPSMLASLHVWPAFLFWALVCAVGLLVLGAWAPETKGVPLDRMDELFSGPWYRTGKAEIRCT